MKNKKVRITIIALIVAMLGIFIYLFLNRNSDTDFNVTETLWMQENKDTVISVSMPTNLPVFSLDGEGVFFEYLTEFEEKIGVETNKVAEGVSSEYFFTYKASDNLTSNDLVFYSDNYVALGKKENLNVAASYLKVQKAGAISGDKAILEYYLEGYNITYYETKAELLEAFDSGMVEYIFVPKTLFLDSVFGSDLHVVHHFNDIEVSYVLSLGEDEVLNSILNKVYKTWDDKERIYYKNLSELYINANEIDEITKTNFKSKRYIYGYVSDMPYDKVEDYELLGVNGEYINEFTEITGIEFSFKQYSTVEALVEAFNNGEVDVIFSKFGVEGLKSYIELTPHVESDYTILRSKEGSLVIDSVKGLKDETLAIEENTTLIKDLEAYTTLIEYKTPAESGLVNGNLIALDMLTYEYYKVNKLADYISIYEGTASLDYMFVVRDCSANTTFAELFNEFIRTENTKKINITATMENEFEIVIDENNILKYLIYVIVVLFVAAIALRITIKVLKENKKKKVIQKDEKMKFFDMMTSLKNRNYLNHNIETWNANTVYPQAIIIIDLNNIKYINDTHGHEAGDEVIVAAANILINNQLENSDIIRTDGNEFLVYLVGYKEKAVVTYMRKLYKQMKTLPFGYGAEIGYSTIIDDIKSIDDAINEATIDMRNNKKDA